MQITPLDQQDGNAIEALLDAAFGANRHGRTAYAVRRGMHWLPELSYAVTDVDGAMVGLLQSWPVSLHIPGGEAVPLVMVGPVAVSPDRQGAGHGRALMDRLIADAAALQSVPLVMIGDPDYYGRFWGFSAAATGEWDVPGPVERHRLLVRALQDEALPVAGMLGPRAEQKAA